MDTTNQELNIEQLMILFIINESTEEQRKILLDWLKQDESNITKLNELRNTLNAVSNSVRNYDTEKAIANFEKSLDDKASLNTKRQIQRIVTIAASIIILFGILWLIRSSKSVPEIIAITTDNSDKVLLTDGTKVTLNSATELSALSTFDKRNRTVYLSGEAFFSVKPDSRHPFVIKSNNITITVLGTSFNVSAKPNSAKTIISVKTGKVLVESKSRKELLTQNEELTIYNESDFKKISYSSPSNFDAWKTAHIVFEDTPLSDVILTLNKHLNTNLLLASDEIKGKKLNATFNSTDSVSEVLTILSIVLSVDIINENGMNTIYTSFKNETSK